MNQSILRYETERKTWVYLPDITTLSLFLNQSDIVILSSICKNYRFQLKPLALRKLIIDDIRLELYDINYDFDYKLLEDPHFFKIKINQLRTDLHGCYNFVKEVAFEVGFSNEFAKEFFKLFPKISKISVIPSTGEYSLKNLMKILYSHDYLKHAVIECISADFKPRDVNLIWSFFYQLKTIKLYTRNEVADSELPLGVIDSSFSNLQSLSVMNNRMLRNISDGLGSFSRVELDWFYEFEHKILSEFINNSRELKTLSISTENMNQAVINSILRSKLIENLIIWPCRGLSYIKSNNLYKNYSIKRLTIEGYHRFNPIKILEACQNVEILELVEFHDTSFFQTSLKRYTGKLQTIIFNSLDHPPILSFIPTITNIKQIKFIKGYNFSTFLKYFKLIKCEYWVPKQDYTEETDEFTLVKSLIYKIINKY